MGEKPSSPTASVTHRLEGGVILRHAPSVWLACSEYQSTTKGCYHERLHQPPFATSSTPLADLLRQGEYADSRCLLHRRNPLYCLSPDHYQAFEKETLPSQSSCNHALTR